MQVDGKGWVNMKPIKGNVARAGRKGRTEEEVKVEDERLVLGLEWNEKDRAENLMVFFVILSRLFVVCTMETHMITNSDR